MTEFFAPEYLAERKYEYADQGYSVYRQILTPEQTEEVKASIIQEMEDLIFRDTPREERPSLNTSEGRQLLVDRNLRAERGISDNAVWRNGNTRQPIYSKNCGLVNIYFNPVVQRLVTFNPKIFAAVAELAGNYNMAMIRGPDRVGMKVKGTVDMPTHLDTHLFEDGLAFTEERVQAFFNASVPEDVGVRDSGTIRLIPYFHRYWQIAKRYFREGGAHELSNEEYRKTIPQPWGKVFDKKLPEFNDFLQDLHNLRDNLELTDKVNQAELEQYGDLLQTLPTTFNPLKWTCIELHAGDLMCWTHFLPHSNVRNKSHTPRITSYLRYLPYDAQKWHESDTQRVLLDNLRNGIPCATKDKKEGDRCNDLEREHLREPDHNYIYVPDELMGFFDSLDVYREFCRLLQGFTTYD